MAVGLYMDHNVERAITAGLRLRGVDVLTSAEDDTATLADPMLLDRATALGRVLVTEDDDLRAEASRRQTQAIPFAGVVYGHQQAVIVGEWVRDLEYLAKAGDPGDFQCRVHSLPL